MRITYVLSLSFIYFCDADGLTYCLFDLPFFSVFLIGIHTVRKFFFLNVQDTIGGGHAKRSSDGTAEEEEAEEDSGVDVEKTTKKKHVELYDRLLKSFSQVPKLSRKFGHDNLAVVNVAPSVVPNPYLPSFRIFSYNVSGTRYEPEMGEPDLGRKRGRVDCQGDFGCWDGENGDGGGDGWEDDEEEERGRWNSSPNSPSRKNGLWTPLGYAQVSWSLYWGLIMDCSDGVFLVLPSEVE